MRTPSSTVTGWDTNDRVMRSNGIEHLQVGSRDGRGLSTVTYFCADDTAAKRRGQALLTLGYVPFLADFRRSSSLREGARSTTECCWPAPRLRLAPGYRIRFHNCRPPRDRPLLSDLTAA